MPLSETLMDLKTLAWYRSQLTLTGKRCPALSSSVPAPRPTTPQPPAPAARSRVWGAGQTGRFGLSKGASQCFVLVFMYRQRNNLPIMQNAAARARAATSKLSATVSRIRGLAMASALLPMDDMPAGPAVSALALGSHDGPEHQQSQLALSHAAELLNALSSQPFTRQSSVGTFSLTLPQADVL